MKEIFAPEIKFCRKPTAFARFIRDRRESGKTGRDLLSYQKEERSLESALVWSSNGSKGDVDKKKEAPDYRFKPLRTIGDTLLAKEVTELVFPGDDTYNLMLHSEVFATQEDIEERKKLEIKRVRNYIETGIPLTKAMAAFAVRKGLCVSFDRLG